jgi:protein-tyrosine phosphatase
MAAVVIEIKKAEDLRDVVHRAVEALSAGKLIVIPTETVYGIAASALCPEAVERVFELKNRDNSKPLALAISGADEALDFVPDMAPLALRIARRTWPGPLTLIVDHKHPDSVINQLEPSVQAAIVPNGTVGLRVPANEIVHQILHLTAGPIVLTSANLGGQPESVDAEMAIESLSEHVDLILDDGPSHYKKPSTLARINGQDIDIVREGVLDKATIEQLGGFIGVVVCTGNTCRSPMGEAIFKKRIADRIGCEYSELEANGVTILSAGIAAGPGAGPAQQSVEVMNGIGVDITSHQSRPVTARLANYADLILTMTNGHRQAILSQWPTLEPRVKTVRCDGGDIADPIGSPVDVYKACADQIDESISQWVNKIDFEQFRKS